MLKLSNIEFSFTDGNRAKDFKIRIDELAFQQHLIYCVIGRNGSGKTTLLNIIGGHIFPDAGRVFLDDQEITTLPAGRRPTATVFQSLGLFPHLSVRGNIEIAIDPNGFGRRKEDTFNRATKIIEDFELHDLEKSRPSSLSIGQQQRVAIGRAVASSPQVLLLDEPTSALDFEYIANLRKLLFRIKESCEVPIIIIVSHDINFVNSIADYVMYIENGGVKWQGNKDEFKVSNLIKLN